MRLSLFEDDGFRVISATIAWKHDVTLTEDVYIGILTSDSQLKAIEHALDADEPTEAQQALINLDSELFYYFYGFGDYPDDIDDYRFGGHHYDDMLWFIVEVEDEVIDSDRFI